MVRVDSEAAGGDAGQAALLTIDAGKRTPRSMEGPPGRRRRASAAFAAGAVSRAGGVGGGRSARHGGRGLEPDAGVGDHQALEAFRAAVDVELMIDLDPSRWRRLPSRRRAVDRFAYVRSWSVVCCWAPTARPASSWARPDDPPTTSRAWRTPTTRSRSRPSTTGTWATASEAGHERLDPVRRRAQHRAEMREDYFAPRERVSSALSSFVELWLQQQADAREGVLWVPATWIGGRSGVGKRRRVAAPPCLDTCAERGSDPLVGQSCSLRPDAARTGVDHRRARTIARSLDRRSISPEQPGGSGDGVVRVAEHARGSPTGRSPRRHPAGVLCCGPSEQGERLKSDLPDDLDVEIYTLGDPVAA